MADMLADTVRTTKAGSLTIASIPCRSDNFGYLLHDAESGAVASIDVPEAAPVGDALDALGWTLTHILITHHHADHVEGVETLRARGDVTVVGAQDDAARLPALDVAVAAGESFRFGAHDVRVLATPGHTVGHIVYFIPGADVLFSGDTLFAMGCGRLFEGTAAQMSGSFDALHVLPDDTLVFFGHEYTRANAQFALTIEPENAALAARVQVVEETLAAGGRTTPTTLREEKATNPFMRVGEVSVAEAVGLPGADRASVFAEVRRRKDAVSQTPKGRARPQFAPVADFSSRVGRGVFAGTQVVTSLSVEHFALKFPDGQLPIESVSSHPEQATVLQCVQQPSYSVFGGGGLRTGSVCASTAPDRQDMMIMATEMRPVDRDVFAYDVR